ncbi:hypothetical protein M413DRAFT_288622 [Hebeloma cylindrosporum]|uniref:Uncharacterized protein n=1 Tax=Hebeloma cylindrosporum TaxID=76867 RepID=A0A0C2XF31_HEBCY|nr:hypothetical protein M413DRAFT_288622 [Hebeloma cylindrosporum h7]
MERFWAVGVVSWAIEPGMRIRTRSVLSAAHEYPRVLGMGGRRLRDAQQTHYCCTLLTRRAFVSNPYILMGCGPYHHRWTASEVFTDIALGRVVFLQPRSL